MLIEFQADQMLLATFLDLKENEKAKHFRGFIEANFSLCDLTNYNVLSQFVVWQYSYFYTFLSSSEYIFVV